MKIQEVLSCIPNTRIRINTDILLSTDDDFDITLSTSEQWILLKGIDKLPVAVLT